MCNRYGVMQLLRQLKEFVNREGTKAREDTTSILQSTVIKKIADSFIESNSLEDTQKLFFGAFESCTKYD